MLDLCTIRFYSVSGLELILSCISKSAFFYLITFFYEMLNIWNMVNGINYSYSSDVNGAFTAEITTKNVEKPLDFAHRRRRFNWQNPLRERAVSEWTVTNYNAIWNSTSIDSGNNVRFEKKITMSVEGTIEAVKYTIKVKDN